MRVCATKDPIEVSDRRRAHVTECWLHGPEDEIPAGRRRSRSSAEEIAVAEEA